MKGPGLTYSQRIESLGEQVFHGNQPGSWRKEAEPKQGGDFGFDMSMWLTELEKIRGRFSVQLKTEVNPEPHGSDEQFFSVPLAKKTCELYFQDGQPVMLVFVALAGEMKADAKVYYLWITDEIKKRLGNRLEFSDEDPEEMTFRVPLANVLCEDLDVSAYLKEYWTITRISNSFRNGPGAAVLKAVAKLSPEGAFFLTKWLTREALDGQKLWASPKSNSVVAKLKSISENITHGNVEEARRAIADFGHPAPDDDEIEGELHYQRGRLAHLDGDTEGALEHFKGATRAWPESVTYFVAEMEAEFVLNARQGQAISEETLHRAEQFRDTQVIKFQMLRIYALSGNRDEAERLLAEMEGFAQREASVSYRSMLEDWTTALTLAEDGLAHESDSKNRRSLVLLKARALLGLVIGNAEGVQVGGRPDLKIELARELRATTLDALRDARLAGWPTNSEMLLDCAAAVSLISGADDELYELLRDFASRRPNNRSVQETLARVATSLGDYEAAAEILGALPSHSIEETARQVMLLGQTGKFSEAVSLATDELLNVPHSKLVDVAVVVAVLSAVELVAIAQEAKLRAYVDSGGNTGKTLLRFLEQVRKNPADIAEHLEEIWPAAIAAPADDAIQDNVFLYLRPNREPDVDRIIELSEIIQKRRRLAESESGKYSAALVAKQRYDIAIEFTASAFTLFPDNENIAIARAVALDAIGQTTAALMVLSGLKNSKRVDVLQTQSQLLLRTGEVEAAVSFTQKALSNANGRAEKFQLQRNLTILYSKLDPTQYFEAAWRLGELSDRNAEEQEGTFLVQFLLAAMPMGAEVQEDRVNEYHKRRDAFVERFPQSPYFRMGGISKDGDPDDTFAAIKKLAGLTDEKIRHQERQRNFGERSGALIPLVMRPGGYSPYCSNVIDLLSVCFRGEHDGQSSKITVGTADLQKRDVDKAPVLDLVTIAVLVRLGLFEKLFRLWDVIAIPKASLENLSRLSLQFLRVGANELLDEILGAVKAKKSKIIQLGATGEGQNFAAIEFEAILEGVRSGQHDFLTADIAAYVCVEDIGEQTGRCRSLWDFLRMAEQKGIITSDEHRLARLEVTSWNSYGVPLTPSDVAAAAVGIVHNNEGGDVDATLRVVSKYFDETDADGMIRAMASALVRIVAMREDEESAALEWFSRAAFSELLLARSPGFPADADELAANVLALIAFSTGPHDSRGVHAIYRALKSVRSGYAESAEEESFVELLGKRGAECLYVRHKNGKHTEMAEEAKLINTLLSCVTEGTSTHDKLSGAFYRRTQELQQR